MNHSELERRAGVLDQALQASANQSKDVEALGRYGPLVSAIRRAKAGEMHVPEELPGTRHWMFETDISGFEDLSDAFAQFHLMLRGLDG